MNSSYRVLTQDGSSLVTNAAIRRPPNIAPRHQFDHAFDCSELRSVDFTAAANDNPVVRAVDATAASFSEGELTAVGTPRQVATRLPTRKRVPY